MTSGKQFPKQDIAQLNRKIKKAKTIAISGHTNPDGDCVGSCLGLWINIRIKKWMYYWNLLIKNSSL